MGSQSSFLVAVSEVDWIVDTEGMRSSSLILLGFAFLVTLALLLFRLGVIGAGFRFGGLVVRAGIEAGFRLWDRYLSWAPWPLFLVAQVLIISAGVARDGFPVFAITCAFATLAMGLAACLAYMFIDVERYEVARGYKALHDPMKGQRLATELVRCGPKVGVPLLAAATVGMVGGFALLNFALWRILSVRWYATPAGDASYSDFVASALVHLLSAVDLLNLANSHHLARVVVVRPATAPASILLALFKSFFTLVLLQQIFASVRKGRLLTETIADFWSPHLPIHERARAALPQYGAVALTPLLAALRSSEALTQEQREMLPQVLATIGPAAIPDLVRHLDDPSEHVRAVAIATLGRLRSIDALPRLALMAADSSDLVRLSVAAALGEIGGLEPRVAPVLVAHHFPGWLFRIRRPTKTTIDPAAIAVPVLRATLKDASASVRGCAAISLGRLGAVAESATPDLIRILNDVDEAVRSKAVEALGVVGAGDPAVVRAIGDLLKDPSPAIRAPAVRALGVVGSAATSAVSDIAPLLQDGDEEVRKEAATAIARIGSLSTSATASLTTGLVEGDDILRARTAEALGDIGEAAEGTAAALVEAVSDDNNRVRAKAVEALGKIGASAGEVAVPRLVRALKDEDVWLRALAAEALGEMGTAADDAVPELVESLDNANPLVRANAAEALGKLGAADAVASLEETARDPDAGARIAAIQALGTLGRPGANSASVVRMAISDLDPGVRAAAAETFGLWGVADDDVRADILKLLDDPNDEVRARAIRTLPVFADPTPAAVDGMMRRLSEDESDLVRVESVRALGRLGAAAAKAGPMLLEAAQSGNADLRVEAIRALAIAQPPEANEAFIDGLRDSEAAVRIVASAGWRNALAIPEDAIPVLVEALNDPEAQVRANAAYAMWRLEPTPLEAVPVLIECAAHPNVGLRLNAALALQSATGALVMVALRKLLSDPSGKIRLIGARRILTDDPTDVEAATVVAQALGDSKPSVRKSASDLIETGGACVELIMESVRGLLELESDPAIRKHLTEAIATGESTR